MKRNKKELPKDKALKEFFNLGLIRAKFQLADERKKLRAQQAVINELTTKILSYKIAIDKLKL